MPKSKEKCGSRKFTWHIAALHGHTAVLEILDDAKNRCTGQKSTRRTDSCGTTPFMDAIKSGSLETLDHIATSHPGDLTVEDKMGRNGLDIAAYVGNATLITHLVSRHGFLVDRVSQPSGMTGICSVSFISFLLFCQISPIQASSPPSKRMQCTRLSFQFRGKKIEIMKVYCPLG